MDIERAIEVARLWKAGKMIGADPDEVCEALLDEVLMLRQQLRHVEAWRDAGEEAINQVAGRGGLFSLGVWWADRPWRKR